MIFTTIQTDHSARLLKAFQYQLPVLVSGLQHIMKQSKMKYSAELNQAAIDDFYRDPNRSTQEIADSFGISRSSFDKWLNTYQKEKHTPKKINTL